MALDGNYLGTIDHAIANLHLGRNQGRMEGIDEGFQQGFQEGQIDGWNQATNIANAQIQEQMTYTRQHIAEKEKIKAELLQQQELIERLAARVEELQLENGTLRKTATSLRELVDALKAANNRLQDQVTELDNKFQERSNQYNEQLWQYNRSLVFINSVRGVLEDLTSKNSSQATHIKSLFAKRYAEVVNESVAKGEIKCAPDQDANFARALPRTKKFIVDMLNSVGKIPEPRPHESIDDDWVPNE